MESIPPEIVQFSFYKNPVFVTWLLYTVFIMISYLYMNDATKNSYVFANTFRDETNDIHWLDIVTLDQNITSIPKLLELVFSPLILYSLLAFILINTVIKPHEGKYQPYFYTIMLSCGILMILFPIHYFVYKLFKGEKIKGDLNDAMSKFNNYSIRKESEFLDSCLDQNDNFTKLSRSMIPFGLPLKGYDNANDRMVDQILKQNADFYNSLEI